MYTYNFYRVYAPVTAYTIDAPVIVNGTNINTVQHPALNFRPVGSPYPIVYLPATEFSRVGANVTWDAAAQRLIITSPACQTTIDAMQRDIDMLKAESDVQKTEKANYGNSQATTRVTSVTANDIRFDAAPAVFTGNYTGNYTMGRSYPYYAESASGGQRGITVKDNFGVWHIYICKLNIQGVSIYFYNRKKVI